VIAECEGFGDLGLMGPEELLAKLDGLEYLDCVIQETLRVQNPLFLSVRRAKCEYGL
jgi:cytochrome P450